MRETARPGAKPFVAVSRFFVLIYVIGDAKVQIYLEMTLFEILNFNRELIKRLISVGFKPDDCQYIELYRDYTRMRNSGDKVTYIVSVLAQRYEVSERKVYSIIKRFGTNCTSGAV